MTLDCYMLIIYPCLVSVWDWVNFEILYTWVSLASSTQETFSCVIDWPNICITWLLLRQSVIDLSISTLTRDKSGGRFSLSVLCGWFFAEYDRSVDVNTGAGWERVSVPSRACLTALAKGGWFSTAFFLYCALSVSVCLSVSLLSVSLSLSLSLSLADVHIGGSVAQW